MDQEMSDVDREVRSNLDYRDDIGRCLRELGVRKIRPLTPHQIAGTNAFLMRQWVYRDAHVPETARKRGEGPVERLLAEGCDAICTTMHAAIVAPYLLERALELTDVAAAYLDCDPPVAYSANVFWTRPAPATRPDIQDLHRDEDDKRFLALFCYLTDVLEDDDGPHELVGPDGVARRIYGPAGTMFLANTSHMHRGIKPMRGTRGMYWWRWGISAPPASYVWDKNQPISWEEIEARYPEDLRLAWSMRLLVTPPGGAVSGG